MVKEWIFLFPDGRERKLVCSEEAARELMRTENATVVQPAPADETGSDPIEMGGADNILPWMGI